MLAGRPGLVSLGGARNALSTVRSCRAAREIQHPHGEYVGRAATVLARYEPPGTSRASVEAGVKSGWATLVVLFLAGCGQAEEEQWCAGFAAATNLSDLINPKTGRLDRDPETGLILDPETHRAALTREEEECVRREAQRAIDRYESR